MAPVDPTPVQRPGMDREKVWGLAKDVLALAIIPLVVWVIKLEVSNAQRDMRIAEDESALVELKAELKETGKITDAIHAQDLKLVSLEGKLDSHTEKLAEIKGLLAHP